MYDSIINVISDRANFSVIGPTSFMKSVVRVLMVGCSHISYYIDYGLSFTLSIYSTLFAMYVLYGPEPCIGLNPSTSESKLWGHDEQTIVLFLINPHLSSIYYILSVRLYLDKPKYFELNNNYYIPSLSLFLSFSLSLSLSLRIYL